MLDFIQSTLVPIVGSIIVYGVLLILLYAFIRYLLIAGSIFYITVRYLIGTPEYKAKHGHPVWAVFKYSFSIFTIADVSGGKLDYSFDMSNNSKVSAITIDFRGHLPKWNIVYRTKASTEKRMSKQNLKAK
jgi:hypothetical protein